MMDAIAREAGLEPYEVRLRNLVRPEQMPYDNVVGQAFRQRRLPRVRAQGGGGHRRRRRARAAEARRGATAG